MTNTKEKILTAALALFARQGYQATSVSTIASELKLTKGALYKHYKNKEDIFTSILKKMGLNEEQIIPVKADAGDLPFEKEFFDAVISVDPYNYFGTDKDFPDDKLLPFLKSGGYVYIAIPGMKKDCHDNLPRELTLSRNAEQLDYIHDAKYRSEIVGACRDADVISVNEMESNEEVWADWLKQENEYAVGDRRTMEAGGGKYLNFIKIVLKKK